MPVKSRCSGKYDKLFSVFFIIVLIYSIWLAPFGIASSDESYYLTVPYRLAQGDVFFVDEWNVAQMTGFVLYPLMKLFLLVSGSTEGIYLVFRYFYVTVTAAVSAYIYFRGRRISSRGAFFAAFILMLFNSYSIRALSYNSIAVLMLAMLTVTAATEGRHPFADLVFAGLCFAAAVLCCPYLALAYVLYALFVLFLLIRRRSGRYDTLNEYIFSLPGFLGTLTGTGILLALFCVFCLSRTTLAEITAAFPYMFYDPEHTDLGMLWYIKNYFYCIKISSPAALPACICFGLIILSIAVDRNRMRHRSVYVLLSMALALLYNICIFSSASTNTAMPAISFLGFTAYLLTENRNKSVFRLIFLPGIAYSFCLHHATTQPFLGICNAASICAVASAFFIAGFVEELRSGSKDAPESSASRAVCGLLCAFLVFQLAMEGHTHSVVYYQDGKIQEFTRTIDRGVMKGLKLREKNAEEYYRIWDDTEAVRAEEDGYVLYISQYTWLPVGDTKRSAAHNSWTYFDKPFSSIELARMYLELHPEKRPLYVYIPFETTYDYQPATDGMLLMDVINTEKRPVMTTGSGYLLEIDATSEPLP